MTEAPRSRWKDLADLPAPTVYHPEDDTAPPFVEVGDVRVMLLLVGEVDRRWAARTAIELCDAWAAPGRRVVLADFHLENPILQHELGGEGLEGVVDIFMYGASVSRCTRQVEGHRFGFIPTGTYTPDLNAIFRDPRWGKLVAEFTASRTMLVTFVPADSADLAALGTWVDRAILLGPPGDTGKIVPLTLAHTPIRGLIVPPTGELLSASSAELPPEIATTDAEAEPAPSSGETEPAPAADRSAPSPEVGSTPRLLLDEDDLHLPPPPPRTPTRRSRAGILLLWILLGVALLAAVGYVVASLRPGGGPPAPDAAQTNAAGFVAPVTSSVARPLGEVLPYSIRVAAYGNFQAAHDRLTELRDELPGVLLYVTPETIQGITYHKVMAGALSNSTAALQLRDRLLEAGILGDEPAGADRGSIQDLRFGLVIGDLDDRASARAAVDSLLVRQIPAYSVAVPHSDGTLHWFVYAGAFTDSVSAVPLRDQLSSAGLHPRLTMRFGSPATPEL